MPRIGEEWRELARDMAANPGGYGVFGNGEKILPKAGRGEYYIEGTVVTGQAQGAGQYRVVCLVNNRGRVVKKYASATHYGDGSDARRKPAFIEFR